MKATPNPYILKVLHEEGFGADCSSLPELLLAEKAGITGQEIMLTSNNTPVEEFAKALELGAILNLDDITHIAYLEEHLQLIRRSLSATILALCAAAMPSSARRRKPNTA